MHKPMLAGWRDPGDISSTPQRLKTGATGSLAMSAAAASVCGTWPGKYLAGVANGRRAPVPFGFGRRKTRGSRPFWGGSDSYFETILRN